MSEGAGAITLYNIVEEWLKEEEQAPLNEHIAVHLPSDPDSGLNGFFISAHCAKNQYDVALAYIGRYDYYRELWSYDLTPTDKNFFPKLKAIMLELHNRYTHTVSCGVKL